MRHLTRAELLAAAESPETVGGARRRHVDDCARCRVALDGIAGALAAARDDIAPEPSPLFWTHFPERVAAAVSEAGEPGARPWPGWSLRRAAAGALVLALATAATFGWRATLHAPLRGPAAESKSVARGRAGRAPDGEPDNAWVKLRAAADGLKWDDVERGDLEAAPGSADRAAAELSPDERAELARLIATEMKRSGA